MQRTIIDFSRLGKTQISALAHALKFNKYEIIIDIPSDVNKPVGLFDALTRKETYQYLLNDEGGSYFCILIKYKDNESKLSIEIPVGVFGASPKHKINYPLLANTHLRNFLDLSRSDIETFVVLGPKTIDDIFNNLLSVRFELLKKIFRTYCTSIELHNSIMSWPSRNKKSITRKAAEGTNFFRKESNDGKTEVYSQEELNNITFTYFKECSGRWKNITENQKNPTFSQEQIEEEKRLINFSNFFYNEFAFIDASEKEVTENIQSLSVLMNTF